MASSPTISQDRSKNKNSHDDTAPSSSSFSSSSSSSALSLDDVVISALTKQLEIPRSHLQVGWANLIHYASKDVRTLLLHRRVPARGWSDLKIQNLLYTLSTMDTNGKNTNDFWCGVGEREGRCYSNLVQNRHFGLCHGMGRSGDLKEAQPKAVGSTILAKLTLCMTLDIIRRGSGLNGDTAAKHGILLPLCTGMSMSLVLQSLRQQQKASTEDSMNNKSNGVVLWSRIDQKSCFKAITTAGFECVVIPTKMVGDQVGTDLDALQVAMDDKNYKGRIVAVLTTTSCFAPRVADSVDQVAKLCQQRSIPHVINHAYGLQCLVTNKLVNRACVVGRVDAIVCSTDKNFLVPVGGAIVMSPNEEVIDRIGKLYAGRASSSPLVDLFITLLSMGLEGYQQVLQERMRMVPIFREGLQKVAEKHGERLLECQDKNTISYGVTLDSLVAARSQESEDEETDSQEYQKGAALQVTQFGSMLFHRCVSGTRVVPRGESKTLGNTMFQSFGSSVDHYPHAYLTAACAIGVTEGEIREFFRRLDKVFVDFKKKQQQKK